MVGVRCQARIGVNHGSAARGSQVSQAVRPCPGEQSRAIRGSDGGQRVACCGGGTMVVRWW